MGCNESSEQAPMVSKARTVDIKSLTKNAGGISSSPRYQESDFQIKVIDIRDENPDEEQEDKQVEQEYDFESPMRSQQKS